MELEPQAAEVLQVVREVSAEVVEARRAQITVDAGPTKHGVFQRFDLVPENPLACPVGVLPDDVTQITLFLGPPGATATLELHDKNRAVILAQLRRVLSAVIAGRYEQAVKVTGTKRRRISVRGVFDLEGEKPWKHRYWGGSNAELGDKRWHTRRFVPY